jgi:hypothetical protein
LELFLYLLSGYLYAKKGKRFLYWSYKRSRSMVVYETGEEVGELRPIGIFYQPDAPEYANSLYIPTPFFQIRMNHNLAFNSQKELGLQVLVIMIDEYMWVNIDKTWLSIESYYNYLSIIDSIKV